ncbi:hypothetical protein LINPERHAP1_LOCUS7585 [Linum perenne]
MHTVEFKKHDLPHLHIVLWLAELDKITIDASVDNIISAELPDPTLDPIGYEVLTEFMVHGPCGEARPSSPCMKDERCSKYFPIPYVAETTFDKNGYVTYRRRATNISVVKLGVELDNAFVVPYNRNIMIKYQAHINVKVCHKGQLKKYLFKYITKGPDISAVTAENSVQTNALGLSQPNPPIDEIAQYLYRQLISSYEAVWRLDKFPIHERSPVVFRMCVYIPGEQVVTFVEEQLVSSIVNQPDIRKTMLTEWFTLNQTCPSERDYTYSNITQTFVWEKQCSQCTRRKQGLVIGHVASSPPRGDVFYLHMLVTKIPGALSFAHLRIVNRILVKDYQQAC